jgi:hypothetical protein
VTHPTCTLGPMTTTNTDLLELLRGRRELRPRIDASLAGGLRAWLEDDLAALVVERPLGEPCFLTPRSSTTEALHSVPSLVVLARAALVSKLVAARALDLEIDHPMDHALSALEADPLDREIVETVHALDPDGFAQLAAEVTAHHSVLVRMLPSIPPSWLPRTNQRLSASLAGGRVVLGATVSVIIGPPASTASSTCLLEVTTSALDHTAARRLGVLALLETLRSGAAPLRVGALSTATGDTMVLDASDDRLIAAVGDVVGALKARLA